VIIFHLWSSFIDLAGLKLSNGILLGAFSIIYGGAFGIIRGAFAIYIRGAFAIIPGAFTIIRGAFTIYIRGAFTIYIRSGFAIIRSAWFEHYIYAVLLTLYVMLLFNIISIFFPCI
jgi:hypothetical protein